MFSQYDLARLEEESASLLSEPFDFLATDEATTLRKIRVLINAAFIFNVEAIEDFSGGTVEVLNPDAVEQTVSAAFQTVFGDEIHPDPYAKAAVLLRGISRNHPFKDGNKRTALLLATYFLQLCGYDISQWPEDPLVEFCVSIAEGKISEIEEITIGLRSFWNIDG
jgi:death on curing protein